MVLAKMQNGYPLAVGEAGPGGRFESQDIELDFAAGHYLAGCRETSRSPGSDFIARPLPG